MLDYPMAVCAEHVTLGKLFVNPTPARVMRKSVHRNRLACPVAVVEVIDTGRHSSKAAQFTASGCFDMSKVDLLGLTVLLGGGDMYLVASMVVLLGG